MAHGHGRGHDGHGRMISYRLEDGTYYPAIFCDACGKEIVEQGNTYWIDGFPEVWHTHKIPCSRYDDTLEEQFGHPVLSEEIGMWLDQLAHNLHREEP